MNVLEYICLDSESKFRSKTVITGNCIDDVAPIVVQSSMISNVVIESHDLVLHPVKCVKNPFVRDDKHWLVLCEIRYPNGTIHKSNSRNIMNTMIDNHSDFLLGITQQFVLFKDGQPMGWSNKIELMKNYSSKLEHTIASQVIIDALIENLLFVGLSITGIEMERIVGKWTISFQEKSISEACDDVFLFRYIAQRLCASENIIISFNSDPIDNSQIYSRCHLSISSHEMRQPDGLRHIVAACQKLEVKHLEQHKFYCEHNGRRFTYGQNNSKYDVLIHLDNNNGGCLEDKRCSADCDLYLVVEKLVKTIVAEYNIDKMSLNLEQLKDRFNYKNAVSEGITRPVIGVSEVKQEVVQTTVVEEKQTKPKPKPSVSGLSGLARILKLNEDSDEEEEETNDEASKETKNMSRVEEIIHTLGKMDISHNILQSVNAPKSNSLGKDIAAMPPDINSLTYGGPMASGPMASGPMASGPMASGAMASGPMASGPMASGPMASGAIGMNMSNMLMNSQIPMNIQMSEYGETPQPSTLYTLPSQI